MQNVIFIDLDGVIVDWYTPVAKLLGLDITDLKVQEAIIGDRAGGLEALVGSKDAVLDAVREGGSDFWFNLPYLPWAKELIDRVMFAGIADIAFLSKPGQWADAYKGKALWRQHHYPKIPLILCDDKGLVASDSSFLIDDDKRQTQRFYNRGGFAYDWPNQFVLLRKGETGWKTELEVLTTSIVTTLNVL